MGTMAAYLTKNEIIMVEAVVESLTTWGDKLRNDEFVDDDEAGRALASVCIGIVQLVRMCDLADRPVLGAA